MIASMNILVLQPYPELPLTVREAGRGRPVLVLHGGGGLEVMADLVEHLAADHRVIAPVHPGWGGTPRPDWFTGVDGLVETYLDLLDDLGLDDVTVVASSFGGWIGAEMAVRDRGRRIGRLVLLNAAGPRITGAPLGFGPGSPARGDGPPAAAVQLMLPYTGPALQDPKLATRLARVAVPVLVVWGEDDVLLTPGYGRGYAAAIPEARFELVPGAGHLPWLDRLDDVLAVVAEFLKGDRDD
ncbi:alpha/beta fold hydrolase [Lentzea sp. NPDC058436]|uniref:alpha/beta fold hydrolase n=1 Tax=Lentzea sp. NPDC058436 TaxID=3346499 RepID=UPI00364BFFAE